MTKYNLELVTRCKTEIDKRCNVTYIDVPTQECKPRQRNRCYTASCVSVFVKINYEQV